MGDFMHQEHNRNSYGFIDNEKVVETIVAYHSRMVFSVIGMFLLLLMPFILKIFVPNTGNSVFGGNGIFHVLLFIFLVCSLVFVGYKALNGGISSIFTWWLWNPACKKANECKLFKSRYPADYSSRIWFFRRQRGNCLLQCNKSVGLLPPCSGLQMLPQNECIQKKHQSYYHKNGC